MHDVIIETHALTKRYGNFAALADCTLQVQRREILGLLGPNGAGKTTLLRLLLGYLRPTSGSAAVDGLDCRRDSLRIRERTAYLPGEARLFRSLRGRDVLRFFADLRGVNIRHAERIAARLDLDVRPRVATLSTGMRQKLALTVTLAAGTPLVILDEPTSSLDPTARAVVQELVVEARCAGQTVVFSSHVLPEVEEISDRVVVLRSGHVVHSQVMRELRQRHRIRARLRGAWVEPPPELASQLVLRNEADDHLVIDAAGELAPILGWLGTLPLDDLRIEPAGLRAIYDQYHVPRPETIAAEEPPA